MRLPAVLRSPPPRVALEIGPSRAAAVSVTGSAGRGVTVDAWAVEPLPPGAVAPSLTAPNVADPAVLADAVGRLWQRLGLRPKRVALLVPDATAKVSIVRFKDVPAKASDLDELVKFQVRKAVPFRLEDSQVSYAAGERSPDGQDFVVVQARREIVEEYERACLATGAAPGIVELASFGLAQCALVTSGGIAGDWLLIHAGSEDATIAIFRGRHAVFFRNRSASGDGHLGELVHQTAMYYQDRLGGQGFARVFAGGVAAGDLSTPVWTAIQERLGAAAEIVGAGGSLSVPARRGLAPGDLEAMAPALGVVASRWAEH
ncbi:MAG TPA: pilus assembly protein PilM [Vicinamibacterales bacterium]|nr:pilus assembly protein PilM [Vicinamibacterales bacterium]HOQ61973.1 pilus assembly protein PilM [Vicinamibacterales bacterium]